MKKWGLSALLALLFASTGAGAMTSQSLNGFTPKVLPVLVQVDSHGKVTGVSPSIELAPRFDRLLRQTVDQLIARPASDHGRPVASQFVMNLTLRTSLRTDGAYDARFAYLSSVPVPSGSWYWVHVDGHRLALMSQGSARPGRVFRDQTWDRPLWRPHSTPRTTSPAASAAPPTARASSYRAFDRPASVQAGHGRSSGR